MTHRLAVLISGSGTNLQTIMAAIDSGRLDAEIAVVQAQNVALTARMERIEKMLTNGDYLKGDSK